MSSKNHGAPKNKQSAWASKPWKSQKATEHGGSLLVGKRRDRRPMQVNKPLHLVLKSQFSVGPRSLLKHRAMIDRKLKSAARQFRVRIYQRAIVANHVHILAKGRTRFELQNFFRVAAGHIAQNILRDHPVRRAVQSTAGNKFWNNRLYSRIVEWGGEFFRVRRYVVRNMQEALGVIPYTPRKRTFTQNKFNSS